jgi:superfamily II DNA helicase RecQ
MRRECSSRISVQLSPAQWRQLYPAIQRMHTQSQEIHQLLDQLYLGTHQGDRQQQSGHGRYTEEMIYGILMTESPFSTQSEQREFRRVSKQWHQFLKFPSAQAYGMKSESNAQEEQEEMEASRWQRLQQVDLLGKLKEMIGGQAEFQGLQLLGLQAIIRRESRVVLVMRTGGGKSLMYMLPAVCSLEGLTIVVVPLTSLQDNQEKRCKEAGLRVATWGDQRAVRIAQVVLVTPESAVTKAFGRFINEKSSARLLDRIVIDECHILLDSINGWRPQVLQLSEMVEKGCQMIYLTATLPPDEEEAFFHSSGLDRREVLLLRDSTVRENVAYRVLEYAQKDEDQEVKTLVQQKLQQYPSPGQIVLYCRSIKQCRRLGELLHCPMYFREVGSKDEKKEILKKLVQSKERVFVATNALGLGIDAPHIRVIVHIGVRSKIRDYAQESGRTGRDGNKAEAIIMRSFNTVGSRRVLEKGWNVEVRMKEFLEGTKCRRISLDWQMDGRVDRAGCEEGEERCDVCQWQERERGRGSGITVNRRRMDWRETGYARTDLLGREEVQMEGSESEVREGEIQERETMERETGEGETEEGKAEEGETEEEETVGEAAVRESKQEGGSRSKRARSRGESLVAEVDGLRASAIQAFRSSEEQLRASKRNRRMELSWQVIDMDRLKSKFTQWSQLGCVVCWTQTGGDSGVGRGHWQSCWVHSRCAQQAMEKVMVEMKYKVEMERFSGCRFCCAPQSICHLWIEKTMGSGSKTASFTMQKGNSCQYKGLVEEIAGAMVSQRMCEGGNGAEWEWVIGEMMKVSGFREGRRAGGEEMEQLWKWMGRRVVSNGIEMSEIVRMIYQMM